MPRLSRKTRLIRAAARSAAEELAAAGDRSVLDAAEKLAAEIKWMSVDGVLEFFFHTAMHEMTCNGRARQIAAVERALNRYDHEGRDV